MQASDISSFIPLFVELDRTERRRNRYLSEVRGHEIRVARLSKEVAAGIGMSKDEQMEVYLAARFHDIGKMQVDPEILYKPGRLTPHERSAVKEHTSLGAGLIGSIWHEAPDWFLNSIRYHHERYDGLGYEKLKGEEIPFMARIIAIADVYDALTSNRTYKQGMKCADALGIMTREDPRSGRSAFDPYLLRVFCRIQLEREGPKAFSTDELRSLKDFINSDPMTGLADRSVTIKANGYRIFWDEDCYGNRKQIGLSSPQGHLLSGKYPNQTLADDLEAQHELQAGAGMSM